ncbi:MAG: hypothetical protein LBO82_10590 [Synergistaceae bacterium]|nr:hypothetical protein [Synergistaceae bacterium]
MTAQANALPQNVLSLLR